jgi:hypothetical protein
MLYSFFWAIHHCLNFMCQCFRTHCLFQLCKSTYEDWKDRVFWNVTQTQEYIILNIQALRKLKCLRHATQYLLYFPHNAIYFIILSTSVEIITQFFISHVLTFNYPAQTGFFSRLWHQTKQVTFMITWIAEFNSGGWCKDTDVYCRNQTVQYC